MTGPIDKYPGCYSSFPDLFNSICKTELLVFINPVPENSCFAWNLLIAEIVLSPQDPSTSNGLVAEPPSASLMIFNNC